MLYKLNQIVRNLRDEIIRYIPIHSNNNGIFYPLLKFGIFIEKIALFVNYFLLILKNTNYCVYIHIIDLFYVINIL